MDQQLESYSKRVPMYGRKTSIVKEDDLRRRHRLMVHYMVHGLDHKTLVDRVLRPYPILDSDTGLQIAVEHKPIPLGEPLTLDEAADVCHVRRKYARWLCQQPAFERILRKETEAFRTGAKARALRRIDSIAHEPGLGKAADRKVQLAASQAVLGELDANQGRNGVTVNVGFSQTTIQPGIAYRLPAGIGKTPLELELEAKETES